MTTDGGTTARGLGHRWRILVKRAKTIYPPVCHICEQPIDETLPATHVQSWTLDHLDPRATHGRQIPHVERVRPAHRGCNSRRGPRPLTTRRWAL